VTKSVEDTASRSALPVSEGSLPYDLRAGSVVFLVALPLCLGIALASGAPLMAGLVTGIVGGIVVSQISRSALAVTGPAAGLTVLVLAGIEELGGYAPFLVSVVICGALQPGLTPPPGPR
jgi:SulP family sulfate permease